MQKIKPMQNTKEILINDTIKQGMKTDKPTQMLNTYPSPTDSEIISCFLRDCYLETDEHLKS